MKQHFSLFGTALLVATLLASLFASTAAASTPTVPELRTERLNKPERAPKPAPEPAPDSEQHCIVNVGAAQDAQTAALASENCYQTRAGVDQALSSSTNATILSIARASITSSPNASISSLARASISSLASNGDKIIGIHFSQKSFKGSSVTIVGTTCSGGVWYPTGSWNNNIESTFHFCGSSGTTFFNSSSCSGSGSTAFASLLTMRSNNNKASCVRYGR